MIQDKQRVSKQKAIELILMHLNKGMVYTDSLKELCSIYQLSERSFNNYWISANDIYLSERKEIEKELFGLKKQNELDQLEKAILTKNESLILLSSIAKGEIVVNDEETKINDRIKAVIELNKLQGNYTEKSETMIKTEVPLFNDEIDYSSLSEETLMDLLNNIKSK